MKARLVLSAAAALLLLAVIFWAAQTDFELFPLEYLRQTGLLFASTGLVLVFMQFVLVSRIKLIEAGFGLDRMLRWHRVFGRTGLAFLIIHAVLLFLYRYDVSGEIIFTAAIWFGLTGLLGFIITAGVASTYRFIGLAYETWRNIHLANYILFPVAMVHVFMHAVPGSFLYYLWIVLAALFAALIGYRLVRIAMIRNNPYRVVEVRQEAKDIWTLEFEGRNIDFKPGQFMFIQLLRGGRLSSPHPFTISTSPTRENLSITPKELGDFTRTIRDTKVGDRAFIDAPYGVFSFLNCGGGELVFIAGGIGITPFISMLRYMYDREIDRKVTLFWANRKEDNLCFKEELRQMEAAMEGFKTVLVMSDQPDWKGQKGRISGEMIMEHLGDPRGKEFLLCGPPGMTAGLIAELKELNVGEASIYSELFQL